jgi:flagellar basal body-associated protein FliL
VYVDLYYKIQEDLRLLKILIGIVIILSTVVMLAMFAIMIYFKRMRNQIKANQTGPATGGDSSSANAYLKKMQKKKDLMDLPVIYSNNRVSNRSVWYFHNES